MPPVSVYSGVFLLGASTILFQIALTRVFAIMMWHHLTYMVVSVALLGFGAAGSLLTASRTSGGEEAAMRRVARAGVAYGAATMLALLLVTRMRVNTLHLWTDPSSLFALLSIYGLMSVTLLLGGYAIGLAITTYARYANRVYFADLLGSGAGGAASVFLLNRFGGAATVILAGAVGTLGGWLFACRARGNARALLVPVLAAGGFAAWVAGALAPLGVPALEIDVPFAEDKEITAYNAKLIEARLPSATAEVEVGVSIPNAPPIMGGDFGVRHAARIEARAVAQDGTAPTQLWKDAARLERFPCLDDTQAASGYRAFSAAGGKDPDVLVIGVGGGIDVMVALAHGAARVDAIEINPAMIRMVRDRYDEYLGGLFRPGAHPWSDRVHLVKSEGRSFMRHSDRRYDLIQMSGVDSFTALATGAYTLSESYLYTVEAVTEFVEHLKDGGIVTYSRFILAWPRLPRETLRLANIAYTALERMGVPDPAASIAVFQGERWASTMIKRGAFTAGEIDALRRFAAEEHFRGLLFDPLFREGRDLLPLSGKAEGQLRMLAERDLVGVPAEDVDGAVLALRHAALAERSGIAPDDAPRMPAGAEPLAARAAEIVPFLRRESDAFLRTRQVFHDLLRAPEGERARRIAAYPYDVSPSTDDAPFFFNYYRYAGLWNARPPGSASRPEERSYHPEYPVGHMILLSSLVQIVALGALLILLPLRALSRRGVAAPHKARVLGYFTALGVGFMSIEIVFMQKVVIFLGHPTYALSVVLTALLGFAGLGSLVATRYSAARPATFRWLAAVVPALIIVTTILLNVLPPALLGLPLAARVIAVVVLIAPLALALGMPFPLGLRAMQSAAPQLVPWAWAINGFASVFASLACILASMAIGFSAVLACAAIVYLAGFLALGTVVRDVAGPRG